ncbi:MAG: tetratricopeptide repeat protein, partial [Thermoanaerobaculia bacterium]|nr:tetratricopeptide repeat protein [Thermoanaerobaculia bacterium]
AVALTPQRSAYHQALGEAAGLKARSLSNPFRRLPAARRAKAEFERAVELDGDNLAARHNLLQYYAGAPGILGGSRELAAEQAAEIALRDPSEGSEARAILLERGDDREEALAAYREAIRLDPENRGARIGLGRLLLELERFEEAWRTLEDALELAPARRRARFWLGQTSLRSGSRTDAAIVHLEALIGTPRCLEDPTQPDALVVLGRLLLRRGDREGARERYRQALALDTDHDGAEAALDEL